MYSTLPVLFNGGSKRERSRLLRSDPWSGSIRGGQKRGYGILCGASLLPLRAFLPLQKWPGSMSKRQPDRFYLSGRKYAQTPKQQHFY